MSFDNHYPNRKDWRRPYHGGRRYDRTCRSHGSCPACEMARMRKRLKVRPADEEEQMEEVKDE